MTTRTTRLIKQAGPEIVLALVILLGGVSVWQAWNTASHLTREARESSHIYGMIIGALNDTTTGAETEALLQLVTRVRETGLPLIVTDTLGRVTAADNLPFDAPFDDPRVVAFAAGLDRSNPPLTIPGTGEIHYGALPAARHLTWLGVLQVGLLALAIAVGIWAYRTAVSRDRERLWIAMARESAHQLGTPLMSAEAWIERLREGNADPAAVGHHLAADLERLRRVAQRFERIGRPARRDSVALGALAERVAAYFEPRLPRHANPVTISVKAPTAGPMIRGDPVLLEWALEALVSNSVDALSGRGGTIELSVAGDGERAQITVVDDGPGIPPELRGRIFEPGVTTKSGGWGIGLPLARRIFEDVHGGTLELEKSSGGAAFVARVSTREQSE